MRLSRARIAAWAVPIACFALSTALVIERHSSFVAATRRARRIDAELCQAYAENDRLAHLSPSARFAWADRTGDEESAFFAALRRQAALADVAIVRLRSQATTLGENQAQSGPASAGAATPQDLVKGATRIDCQIVLDGSYPAMRRFVRDLGKADRLYTLSDVSWSRAKNGTELSVTLSRYLKPEPTEAKAHPATPLEAPNS